MSGHAWARRSVTVRPRCRSAISLVTSSNPGVRSKPAGRSGESGLCSGSLRSPPTRDLGHQAKKSGIGIPKRDAAVEKAESQSREFLQQMIDEPEGPWRYLAERANQVRDLRDRYRDRQRAAQEESERLQQRLSAADDLVDAAQEIRKALAVGEPIDIEAAKTWLDALPGGQIGERLAERWQGFAAIDAPVVHGLRLLRHGKEFAATPGAHRARTGGTVVAHDQRAA